MGFGGSAAAMLQSLRNNAKQLAKRKKYFEKEVPAALKEHIKFTDYKKMPPAEFEAFKKKLKENELNRQKRLFFVFGGIMIVIIGAISYFLFFY